MTTMQHVDHNGHMSQIEAIAPISEMTHVAVKNGAWSDSSTWASGEVPGSEANVHIPTDVTVTYDVSEEVPLNVVRVDGVLTWATDVSTEMLVETIVSTHGSQIEVGSLHNAGINADVTAEITFRDTAFDSADTGQLGHGLVAMGRVDVMGAEKQTHLVIEDGADAGSRTINVEGDTTNWKVGDTILLVGTGEGSRDEEREITSVDGETITFDEALSYNHRPPAGFDFDTYVGNLSNNVVFSSENPEGVRGHLMLMNGTVDQGEYANSVLFAEFQDMGRTDASITTGTHTNPDGRYAIHLHEIGTEAGGPTSLIQGNAVHGTPGWAIVQHSSAAQVNDNIVYDAVGAGIVSEQGDETGMWLRNLVTSVAGTDRDHFLPGVEGAAYENQSRVIIQQDNIAANSEVGWNFFGRETFEEDAGNSGAPTDGSHRQLFDRDEVPFDPSPFDVALDHEEPPITDFNNNTVIASGTGLRVFHRQTSDDSDTMNVFRNFSIWGGSEAVALDNYASNYEFIDSVWQGSDTGFSIQRKTSSVVFNNVEFHGFDKGYRSWGVNHEVVLIDTDFHNVGQEFELNDLLRNVTSTSDRNALISYFNDDHGIDYTNPLPQIIDSATLTPIDAVYFTADANSDLTIGGGDRTINITGTITDSVGTRNFNEYVIAKPPNGSGTSKDFEGISLTFESNESDSQKEFTVDQFLALHGTYQKSDGTWVSPVVNWITDRLTGDQHPVVIEIKLVGFDNEDLVANKLDSYPDPGINNPAWYAANAAPVVTITPPADPVTPPADPVTPPADPVTTDDYGRVGLISGKNVVSGGDGNDLIVGGFDADNLSGGAGADIIRGDVSKRLFGNDRIEGGAGNDLLEGRGGVDTFVFKTDDGFDTIGALKIDYDTPANTTVKRADFVSGVDIIELSGFGLANTDAAFEKVTDVDGVATFNDQGTTITFAGLTVADLTADDFILV